VKQHQLKTTAEAICTTETVSSTKIAGVRREQLTAQKNTVGLAGIDITAIQSAAIQMTSTLLFLWIRSARLVTIVDVISGAISLTQQALRLDLLGRLFAIAEPSANRGNRRDRTAFQDHFFAVLTTGASPMMNPVGTAKPLVGGEVFLIKPNTVRQGLAKKIGVGMAQHGLFRSTAWTFRNQIELKHYQPGANPRSHPAYPSLPHRYCLRPYSPVPIAQLNHNVRRF
jgi:hypothetical protein